MTKINVKELLDKEKYESLNANGVLVFERECLFAQKAIDKSDTLARAATQYQDHLKDVMYEAASVEITLDPSASEAYLKPSKVKMTINRRTEYVLVPSLSIGYIGLIKLAREHGGLENIYVELVFEQDKYKSRGKGQLPIHEYDPFEDQRSDLSKCRGGYAVADFSSGKVLVENMSAKEILKIKAMSDSLKNEKMAKYSPWTTFESEMWKKTILRRIAKLLPKTKKMVKSLEILNKNEGIDFTAQQGNKTQLQKQAGVLLKDDRTDNIERQDVASFVDEKQTDGQTVDSLIVEVLDMLTLFGKEGVERIIKRVNSTFRTHHTRLDQLSFLELKQARTILLPYVKERREKEKAIKEKRNGKAR